MDDFTDAESDDIRTWSERIKRAVRDREARALAVVIKPAALVAAAAGRIDLVERWLRYVPADFINADPQLLYWAGASLVLKRPDKAYPLLRRSFDELSRTATSNWALLAWAGLVDAIFLMYRDLRELDTLIDWMTLQRESMVDQLPASPRSMVVGSAMFAIGFRQPLHARAGHWRERAERLFEVDPTSNLGARLAAALSSDYTWRGDLAAAEVVSKRVNARASRIQLPPLAGVIRCLVESTLLLHQGQLQACLIAVKSGLKLSSTHHIRIWDGVMCCHAISASLSLGKFEEARVHLAAVEQLFADGLPVDEAYYRAMRLWNDFVVGNHVGAVSRCAAALELTEAKGVPYLQAVCQLSAALVLFESGHRDQGRALLAQGQSRAREVKNSLLMWIGYLFDAHMAYVSSDGPSGDISLERAMRLGRDHSFAHFFCWPRQIVVRLIDRALERGYSIDYARHLIAIHSMTPGPLPARSDHWGFAVRIYTFGEPRIEHADGRVEPLSAQFQRQMELLAVLISHNGRPTPLHRVASDVYADEDVDPSNSIKRVLHSLRSRIGPVIVQQHASLTVDFNRVWIDACSFQGVRPDSSDAIEIEAWLDRYYDGHFMDRVASSPVIATLRRRFTGQAERSIREALRQSRSKGDHAALRRLEVRWQSLFPEAFGEVTR